MSIKKQQGRRLNADTRKAHHDAMIDAALYLAGNHGYTNVTRQGIADRVGVSVGLVSLYLGSMAKLRRDIMRHAVVREAFDVVSQGLAVQDPHAMRAPEALKHQAFQFMKNSG